jgi:hypothetical protein
VVAALEGDAGDVAGVPGGDEGVYEMRLVVGKILVSRAHSWASRSGCWAWLERLQAPAASAMDGRFVLGLPKSNGGVMEMRTKEGVV